MKSRKLITLLLALFVTIAMVAMPSRPNPPRLVNDLAHIFSAEQVASLEKELVAFDDSTSNQILVLTVPDLEGYEPAEYATKIGLDWGVGSKDFNNGIVLLVKPKTSDSGGKVSIQVGYGLEGAIPDAYAKRIIENDMIPSFKEGDMFKGVQQACDELMALASGEISEPRSQDEDNPIAFLVLFFLLLFVIFIIIGITNGGNHGKGGSGNHSGGSGPIFFGPIGGFGGSSSGGSFGGFGGGGFGGFGGGSFGGGGASGGW